MDVDARLERDVYTWLATVELSQYYFLFKEKGHRKCRDVVYMSRRDLLDAGVTDPSHLTRLERGLSKLSLPESGSERPGIPLPLQSGRLLAHIYSFVDYHTLTRHVRVCKFFRTALKRGIPCMTLARPIESGCPVTELLQPYERLRYLGGLNLGADAGALIARGLLFKSREIGAPHTLLHLNLTGGRITDAGFNSLAEVLGSGALSLLETLVLDGNGLTFKSMVWLDRVIASRAMPALELLGVSGNPIGNDGTAKLCEGIGSGNLPFLHTIRLATTRMGDQGLLAIDTMLQSGCCPALEALDLRWNPGIGRIGGQRLVRGLALKASPLKRLQLRGHHITGKEITDRLFKVGSDLGIDISL